MDKDFFKGIKIGLGFILVISILGLVSAVGFHVAEEVMPGTFIGDYIFDGSLTINSPTSQGKLNIGGVSDNGQTYSAIYLNDNTFDKNDTWVIGHKNETGTNLEGDLIIGKFISGTLNRYIDIDSSTGNMGLGTTNPGAKLEIYGGGNLLFKDDGTDPGDIVFEDNLDNQKGRIWSDPSGDLKLHLTSSDNTPDITIDDNGYVGIGTTTPRSSLEVNGGIRAKKGDSVNQDISNVGFSFENDGDTGMFAIGGNPTSLSDLIFKSDDAERMRIGNDGNVGIGTTIPQAKLEVNGNIIASDPTASNHVATKNFAEEKTISTTVNEVNNANGAPCTSPSVNLPAWMLSCGSRYCKSQGYGSGFVVEYAGNGLNDIVWLSCFN